MLIREILHVSTMNSVELCFIKQMYGADAIYSPKAGKWIIKISKVNAYKLWQMGVRIVA